MRELNDPAAGLRVAFTALTAGQVVGGRVTIRLVVAPAVPISQITVYTDGNLLGTALSEPYQIIWDTRTELDGPHVLFAKATDAEFRQASTEKLTVIVDNTPPQVQLTAPQDGVVLVGIVHLAADAEDVLGVRAVRFLLNGESIGEATTSPYVIDWDSRRVPNVPCTLRVRVLDRANNEASSVPINVRISNTNRYPVLSPIGSKTVEEGVPLAFRVEAKDPDGARDPLVFRAMNLPTWATLDPKTGEFRGTPSSTEATIEHPHRVYEHVNFDVCDPEPLCVHEEVSITVANHDNPPVLEPVKDLRLGEGDPLSIVLVSSDPDGDPLTCKARQIPFWATFDPSTCTLAGTPPGDAATLAEPTVVYDRISFEVCDPEQLCASRQMVITVFDVQNRPPVFDPLLPQILNEGGSLSLTVTVTDADRDHLTLVSETLPRGMTFEDHGDGTGVYQWHPAEDQSGQYDVEVAATDSQLETHQTLHVTVRETSLAISGMVDDRDTGFPVKGATVSVSTNTKKLSEATTNEDGVFVLKDLRAGKYFLRPSYLLAEKFSAESRRAGGVSFDPVVRKVEVKDKDVTEINFTAIPPRQ